MPEWRALAALTSVFEVVPSLDAAVPAAIAEFQTTLAPADSFAQLSTT